MRLHSVLQITKGRRMITNAPTQQSEPLVEFAYSREGLTWEARHSPPDFIRETSDVNEYICVSVIEHDNE